MGLLSWLKGAAKRSAKNNKRSSKQQNKPKKKKERAQPKQQKQSRQEPSRRSGSQQRQSSRSGSQQSRGGAYRQKTYTAGSNKSSTFQPRTFKPSASKTQARYKQFKASDVAPKAYKAKTSTVQSSAQDAYKKLQKTREIQKKNGTVTTTKPKTSGKISDQFKVGKGDLQKAYNTGKNITTLGTKQKKETITLKTKKEQKKEYKQQKTDYYKSKDWKSTKADLKTYNQQRWRKALSDQGMSRKEIDDWMNSEEGMKHRRETYNEMKAATKKNINKGIAKDIKDKSKLETVNALNKEEFGAMVTASGMGKKQGNKFLKSRAKSFNTEDIREKIGSKTAAAAYKGKFATGVMQGSGFADVVEGNVGTYNKAAKEANRQTKESNAYMAGYAGGQMAGFGLTKTTAAGKALAQTAFKSAAKSTGKKVARNAAMTAAAESPMNMLDAVKMATDENGKINKKALAGYMALNTGLSGGVSAGLEGLGVAFTKKNANKLVSLQAKASTGRLTKEEGEELKSLYSKLDKARQDTAAASSGIADEAYTTGRQMVEDARIARGKEKGAQRAAAAQAENTAAQNAKVDRAVEQSKGTMQSTKNKQYNDSLSSYLKRLEDSRNERGLMRGNEDVIENSASGGIVKEAPDSTKTPEGVKTNKNIAKSSHKAARDELASAYSTTPAKYSKAEAEEINDSVDRISNMLAHGNEADARAEAQSIARKYGNVDRQFEDVNVQAADLKRIYADARHHLQSFSFRMPQGAGETIDKWLEARGTSKAELGRKLKIRRGTGTSKTYSIDEVWDELCDEYPDIFSREITDPNDRFDVVIDVALKKADDIPDTQMVDILPEDLNKMYDDLADRVFAQAESNVKGMKGDIPGRAASADFEAAKPKEAPAAEATPSPKEEKPNPAAPYREEAENLMQKAKNQRENERVGSYVEKLKSGETEPPAAKAEEPKPEPKPGDVKDDLKPLDNMGEADLDKVIYGQPKHLERAIAAYGEDAPRVKQIQEYIEEAKKRKSEINKAKDEALQEKPGYAALTEDELAPDDPAWSIKVRDDSAPTEPVKGEALKKADKGDNAIMPKSGKMASLRRLFVNSLTGFEDFAKKNGNKKMLNQINNVQHWRNKMASWIEGERSGMDRKTSGEGLNSIFQKQELFGKANVEKRNDFVNYLTYKHAIDRLDYDKPVHMDPEGGSMYSMDDYADMIEQIEAKYRTGGETGTPKALAEFEQDIRGYFDDLMQLRVDSGLVSKEFAENLKEKYPHYIPTLREGDEWMENGIEGGGKQAFGVDNQIKTATGGSSQILDLYQSAAQITRDVIRDAEQNELLRQYAEALGVNTKKVRTDDLMELPSFAATVSRENDAYRVTFFQNGEMVTMPVDKQIAKGLREINGQDYQRLLRLSGKLSGAMRLFKAPITDYNLIFGVRNGARDIQQAAVNSKSIRHFSANVPVAQASILRKLLPGGKPDPWLKSYEANGGMYSTFFQQDKKVVEPGAKKGIAKGLDATAGKGLRAIEAANSAIEATPRLAEYIGTIKKDVDAQLRKQGSSLKQFKENLREEMKLAGKDLTEEQEERFADEYAKRILEMASKDTLETASRNAADITLNFSRNGVIGKALNSGLVPYFNPSVQGLSKTVRMFTENKAEGMKHLMNFGIKIGAITMAPAAINEIMLRDNRDYQNLATREKDANFFIPFGDDGKFIKIPKPRENSVLAEPVGYGLRYFFDKARIGEIEKGEYSQWKDLGQMFLSARENIGPVDPFTDNLVSPLIRLAQNKTWYGGSIESVGEVIGKKEGELKNSEISDDTTSALALWVGNSEIGGKKISDIMHMSPKKIDDFMDSYFGMVYDLGISQTSDRAKAERTWQNNPVAAQFVKDSVFSNKNGTELWAEFERANAPDTLGGKVKQKAKDVVLGHSALNINEKTQESKDWLNQKGYDDMTYSTALSTIRGDDSLTKKQKEQISRNWKKAQNEMRRDLVYGSKEVVPEKDPIRIISKSVGVDKAMKDYTYTYVDPETGEKKNQHLDAWNAYKKSGEYKADNKKGGEKFIDFYSKMRWTNGRIGESKSYPSWMTASVLAATEKGNNDALAKSYIRPNGYDENGKMTDKTDPEYQEKIIQRGKNYRDAGFSQAYFRKSQKTLFQSSRKLGYEYKNKMNPWDEAMSLANDKAKYKDGAYYSADTSGKVSRRMNYARGLNEKGYKTKEIYDFAKEYDLKLPNTSGMEKADRGKAWSAFDAKVEAAVNDKYGDKTREEKALIYHVITDDSYHKPFGDVGDYSLDGDAGLAELDARENSGWGRRGYRRRGRRWGHGGGGGGGGGATFNPEVNKAGGAAKQTITKAKVTSAKVSSPFTSNTSNTSKKSNLDDAYRKRAKKLRQTTYKS